jgi:hypothetical protein
MIAAGRAANDDGSWRIIFFYVHRGNAMLYDCSWGKSETEAKMGSCFCSCRSEQEKKSECKTGAKNF